MLIRKLIKAKDETKPLNRRLIALNDSNKEITGVQIEFNAKEEE